MSDMELHQRVLGLLEDLQEYRENAEYPKTVDAMIEHLEKISELMDEPID